MRNALLAFLIFGICGIAYSANPNVVLIVTGNDHAGTGFVYKDGYILTAAHLYHKKLYLGKKDGPKLEVVKRDEKLDLMILKGDVKGSVKFADAVLDGETLTESYTLGFLTIIHGRVCAIFENGILLDSNLMHGSSGAPVFQNGKVIGLVSRFVVDGQEQVILGPTMFKVPLIFGRFIYLIPAKTIQEFIQ